MADVRWLGAEKSPDAVFEIAAGFADVVAEAIVGGQDAKKAASRSASSVSLRRVGTLSILAALRSCLLGG